MTALSFGNQQILSSALLCVMLATCPAFGRPYHRTSPSEAVNSPTYCVFPDGTSPSKRPEQHCYNPKNFLSAYGIDRLHEMGLTGKGQIIIFADSFGSPTMQQDLDHFSDTFGLPRTTIEFVYPNGEYKNPLSNGDQIGWAEETTLDLEWGHAIAPDAKLVNIVTNNSETTGMTGMPDLFKGIQMALEKYPNAIVSMSFGTGEATFTAAEAQEYLLGSFHKILQDATAHGYTLLASAGDSGSAELNLDQSSLLNIPTPSYPAIDPLITSVGGTSIQSGWRWSPEGMVEDYWDCKIKKLPSCPKDFLKAESSARSTESVWKEDWALAAGGGGISSVFNRPDYQLSLPDSIQQMGKGKRTMPDVSLNAAINGGVAVFMSFLKPKPDLPAAPTWQAFGGTSCSSPEFAGLIALAGEQASRELGENVGIGYLNPVLYQLPSSDFRDIVSEKFGSESQVTLDSNALYFSKAVLDLQGPTKVPPIAVSGYPTTIGYDLATGFGTPQTVRFVHDVAAARVDQR